MPYVPRCICERFANPTLSSRLPRPIPTDERERIGLDGDRPS